MLGEGWPLTLRGTIATETGLDLVMVPLKGRGEPVSAVTPHGFALAVDTSIPPHFTGNQMGTQATLRLTPLRFPAGRAR